MVLTVVSAPISSKPVSGQPVNSDRLLDTRAFTGTDRGLLQSVLGPWSPVPKCDAPRAPISVEEHTSMHLGPAAKVRILRFKNLPPFRHYRGLQHHV
jgi:hypothetical protein